MVLDNLYREKTAAKLNINYDISIRKLFHIVFSLLIYVNLQRGQNMFLMSRNESSGLPTGPAGFVFCSLHSHAGGCSQCSEDS